MRLDELNELAKLLGLSPSDVEISADETAKGAVAVIYFPWDDMTALLGHKLKGHFDDFGSGNGRGWINIAD